MAVAVVKFPPSIDVDLSHIGSILYVTCCHFFTFIPMKSTSILVTVLLISAS